MAVEFPNEAVGIAVGVFTYSFASLACLCIMIWLLWVHHERSSFTAVLSYFAFLSIVASILQQVHTLSRWRTIKAEQYSRLQENIHNPEIIIAGGSVGIDLILFYIQFYSYKVEALITLFWAVALTRTIYGFHDSSAVSRPQNKTRAVAVSIAVVLPAVMIALLQAPTISRSSAAFLLLADFDLLASVGVGSLLVLAVLVKYFHTRRRFLTSNIRSGSTGAPSARMKRDTIDLGSTSARGFYDSWLVIRFTVVFVMLDGFGLATVLFQMGALRDAKADVASGGPDPSLHKAKSDFTTFVPGVTPGFLILLTFGTTRLFRERILRTFAPRRFRERPKRGTSPLPELDLERDPTPFPDTTRPTNPHTSTDSVILLQHMNLRRGSSTSTLVNETPVMDGTYANDDKI